MAYAPSAFMDKDTFLSLCRVNKLLHKHTCTSAMAGAVFESALRPAKQNADASPRMDSAIGFNQFRHIVVPEFSKLKKMEEIALVEKLSLCEFPASVTLAGSNLSRSHKENPDTTVPLATAPTETAQSGEGSTAAESARPKLHLNVSAEFVTAFTQLQSISRRKFAKRKLEQLKELRNIETGVAPRSRRPTVEPELSRRRASKDGDRIKSLLAEQEAVKREIKQLLGQGSDDDVGTSFEETVPEPEKELTAAEIAEHSLHDLFDLYCSPPGEMDGNSFKKMMRETYTLTKK